MGGKIEFSVGKPKTIDRSEAEKVYAWKLIVKDGGSVSCLAFCKQNTLGMDGVE